MAFNVINNFFPNAIIAVEYILGGCVPTAKVASTPGGERVKVYPQVTLACPEGIWDQRYPTPRKDIGPNTLHLPRKDLVPGIAYTRPPPSTDKRLWKHYLPAISLAVGNKANYGWWKSSFNWVAQSTNFWMGSIPILSSTPPSVSVNGP